NQGLLVTSLEAFARYHGITLAGPVSGARAAVWERLALIRARFAAGDPDLGRRAEGIARRAAFDEPVDAASLRTELRRIRDRSQREASLERGPIRDIKLGRGGLFDVELVTQYLVLSNAARLPESSRAAETTTALEGLVSAGVLDDARGATLLDAYAFLRRLELRVRVARADAAHVLDTASATLSALARRMGERDHATRTAAESLLVAFDDTRSKVEALVDEILGE
ncbi:MAG TPA: bifunctional [glutamate--ammonia ligase]-adenylyl-L-tyrosine phosphorylase/[glutamate--ammonia-ligase] adenylyltransferase, partial [Polyangiaceae bacterium]|nr:bifunctional [glutamate--ammonia ligase]-adenylyl-L-tyrosine phosphorylase/[glutamate--ammonia-ligase] adenylyltransferase [Polyangiaceae bacterium]